MIKENVFLFKKNGVNATSVNNNIKKCDFLKEQLVTAKHHTVSWKFSYFKFKILSHEC
jgi:hypothetical protein